MFKKRNLLVFLALLVSLTLVVGGCGTQTAGNDQKSKYPERAMEVIVGWGAGGGTDVFARAITKPASEILGKPMPVKNMTGSSGAVAGDYITNQPADGYTIWAMGANYANNVALGRTPHVLDEYIPIARIQHDTAMIQVSTKSQFKTIQDLVDYIKANPGKVRIGGTGALSFDEVELGLWKKQANLDFIYVPYEKGGEMKAALLGGHVDAMFEELGPTAGDVEKGTIKPIMAFTDKKIAKMPDLPISKDLGWDLTLGNWRGVMVKKGTPDDVVKALREAFAKAKDDPGYKKIEADGYLDLRPGYLDGPEFGEFIKKEINVYTDALKQLGKIK